MLLKKRGDVREDLNKSPAVLMLLTSFLTAIVLFFQTWRNTAFTIQAGVSYLIFLFLLVTILMLVFFRLQKFLAKKLGYAITYKPNTNVQLISVLLGFIFRGFLFLIFLGEAQIEVKGNVRLGKFRPDLHVKDLAVISIVGVAVNIVIALVLSGINAAFQNALIKEAAKICMFFSLFMLLPCPNNPGLSIFLWNKAVHLTMLVAALLLTILILAEMSIMIPLLVSLFVALLLGFMEYIPKILYS